MPDDQDQLARDEATRNDAIAKQQEVKDKLTAEVYARDKARLEAFHANKNATDLPLAPQQPAPITAINLDPIERRQEIERGETILAVYQEAGNVAQRDPSMLRGANFAEQAFSAEKLFRERQERLANQINDPGTAPEQRERLALVKTAEYHSHKAAQIDSIMSMERDMMGYSFSDKSANQAAIDRHKLTFAHHNEQASLAANKLYAFDQKRNRVPAEVQAQLGHAAQPALQHNTQGQNDLTSDPHLQTIADGMARQDTKQGQALTATKTSESPNPASARLAARLQAARERNDASTTPELDARVQEIGACRDKLAAAQEMRKTEALGQKAELEQRAARHH